MPRKRGDTELSVSIDEKKKDNKDLDQLIPAYARYNTNYKELKGLVDTYNADIKKAMKEANITTKEAGDWKASYIVQKRESFNEDKLIEILMQDWNNKGNNGIVCPYIKTKFYVDFDVLEDYIYKGEIGKELLLDIDSCKEVKEVEILKVTKVKK